MLALLLPQPESVVARAMRPRVDQSDVMAPHDLRPGLPGYRTRSDFRAGEFPVSTLTGAAAAPRHPYAGALAAAALRAHAHDSCA